MCMIKKILFGVFFILAFAGCAATAPDQTRNTNTAGELSSDFEPPEGGTTGPGVVGPWNSRFLLARSDDGLQFTKLDILITDQADSPDMILAPNGWLYLYYTGWTLGDRQNTIAVAISSDLGATWIYKYVEIAGFQPQSPPMDPDIELLDDGTFRLYMIADQSGGLGPAIHYAEGVDGIRFEWKGIAFQPDESSEPLTDPVIAKVGDTWHLFQSTQSGVSLHLISSDGTAFSFYEQIPYIIDGLPHVLADYRVSANGGSRMYAFSKLNGDIRSLTTNDGYVWMPEPGARLTVDETSGLEEEFVNDPAVVQLPDGSYMMVYVTRIPSDEGSF